MVNVRVDLGLGNTSFLTHKKYQKQPILWM